MAVYVVQTPKPSAGGKSAYDISPCLDYGTPVFIFEAQDQPGLTPVPSIQHVKKVLRNFGDDDYILWAGGDPAGMAIVATVACEVNGGKFKFLRWERDRGDRVSGRSGRGYYMVQTMDFRTKAARGNGY